MKEHHVLTGCNNSARKEAGRWRTKEAESVGDARGRAKNLPYPRNDNAQVAGGRAIARVAKVLATCLTDAPCAMLARTADTISEQLGRMRERMGGLLRGLFVQEGR